MGFDESMQLLGYLVDLYRSQKSELVAIRAENVQLKQDLANALADDKADKDAIAAAKADAEDARKQLADAQAKDAQEQAELEKLLAPIKDEIPAPIVQPPATTVEETPVTQG